MYTPDKKSNGQFGYTKHDPNYSSGPANCIMNFIANIRNFLIFPEKFLSISIEKSPNSIFKKTYRKMILNFYLIFLAGIVHNKSSVAGTSVLSPASNIILILSCSYIVGSKTLLYERFLIPYLLYFGVSAAKITNRLIIAGMTKSEIRKGSHFLIFTFLITLQNILYAIFISGLGALDRQIVTIRKMRNPSI